MYSLRAAGTGIYLINSLGLGFIARSPFSLFDSDGFSYSFFALFGLRFISECWAKALLIAVLSG